MDGGARLPESTAAVASAAETRVAKLYFWGRCTREDGCGFSAALFEAGLSSTASINPRLEGAAAPDAKEPIELPHKLLRKLDVPLELQLVRQAHDQSLRHAPTSRVPGHVPAAGHVRGGEAEGALPCNPASYLDEVERACDPEGHWVGSKRQPSREDKRTNSDRFSIETYDMYGSHVPSSATPRSRLAPSTPRRPLGSAGSLSRGLESRDGAQVDAQRPSISRQGSARRGRVLSARGFSSSSSSLTSRASVSRAGSGRGLLEFKPDMALERPPSPTCVLDEHPAATGASGLLSPIRSPVDDAGPQRVAVFPGEPRVV